MGDQPGALRLFFAASRAEIMQQQSTYFLHNICITCIEQDFPVSFAKESPMKGINRGELGAKASAEPTSHQ